MTLPPGERITVGLVRGLHGLRGAVRVEVLSDEPTRFDVGRVLYAEGSDEPLTIAWSGPAKPGLLLRFEERPSRDSVEPLRDRYLEAIPESALPPGTFYWHQIVGLQVRTVDGEVLGIVAEVFRAGEGEVYVVRGGPRGEILVPAVRSVVRELAPETGSLVVDPVALALPDVPPGPEPRQPERPGTAALTELEATAPAPDEAVEAPEASAEASEATTPVPEAPTPAPEVTTPAPDEAGGGHPSGEPG